MIAMLVIPTPHLVAVVVAVVMSSLVIIVVAVVTSAVTVPFSERGARQDEQQYRRDGQPPS
jgi:flagellar biosynthesis/type III secretory pathway M-ring protein FliF/YscJ